MAISPFRWLPGGDVLEANTGFRVFGTQTSMGKNFDDSGGGGVVSQFLKHLWTPIDLQPLQMACCTSVAPVDEPILAIAQCFLRLPPHLGAQHS